MIMTLLFSFSCVIWTDIQILTLELEQWLVILHFQYSIVFWLCNNEKITYL